MFPRVWIREAPLYTLRVCARLLSAHMAVQPSVVRSDALPTIARFPGTIVGMGLNLPRNVAKLNPVLTTVPGKKATLSNILPNSNRINSIRFQHGTRTLLIGTTEVRTFTVEMILSVV